MPESCQIEPPGRHFVDFWGQGWKVRKSGLLHVILSTSGAKARKSQVEHPGRHFDDFWSQGQKVFGFMALQTSVKCVLFGFIALQTDVIYILFCFMALQARVKYARPCIALMLNMLYFCCYLLRFEQLNCRVCKNVGGLMLPSRCLLPDNKKNTV